MPIKRQNIKNRLYIPSKMGSTKNTAIKPTNNTNTVRLKYKSSGVILNAFIKREIHKMVNQEINIKGIIPAMRSTYNHKLCEYG